MLSRASTWLCGCHSAVRGRVCSLVVGAEAPSSVSELWCEVGGIEVLPLGEEPLNIPLLELATGECALWCHLKHLVHAHKVQCCWHCPWPCLNCGSAGNRLWCPSGAVNQATGTDLLKSGTRTHCGSYGSSPDVAQPLCTCTHRPTAAKARPSQPREHPLSTLMSSRC